ncbi:MAG: hypothetical protein ACOWWR_18205 [Eubacteriales bacterium]
MEDQVLVFERDWERIKETQLEFLSAEERDAFLIRMVKLAVYN